MSGYDVIQEVKKRMNLNSDNQLAKAINKSRQNVSGWKKQGKNPDTDTILDLMIAGDLTADETKKLLNSKSEGGFAELSLMIVTALFMSLIYMGVLGEIINTLYIMRSIKGNDECTFSAV